MNNWKINKTVDLAHGIDGVEVWPHALLVTGDKNAHEWNVTVMDNGNEASLSGVIEAYFVRSDGATVTATGSVSKNVATVTLPEACYAYEGDLQAVMQLIQDDVSVTLSALLLRVRQITTDVIIDPGTEIPSLDDLLAQIESMKQATKDANTATTNANQAATNAETRVDEAISDAEGRVDTAVQSAETATSKANASAAKADASKAAADTAASAANEAADRANKAASGVGIRKKIVDVLPAKSEMEQDVLYLVHRAEPNADNVYDEYMLINGEVEAIGSTKTDLEDYATKEYVGEQIDGIEIGGTNLFALCNAEPGYLSDDDDGTVNPYHSNNETTSDYISVSPGEELTIQVWTTAANTSQITMIYYMWFSDRDSAAHIGNAVRAASEATIGPNYKTVKTVPAPDDAKYIRVTTRLYSDGKVKVERGNKPTDWSPAPEDMDAEIDGIEIGGRNYLLNSKARTFSSYLGSVVHFDMGVSVPEWGANDAIRAYGTGGTSKTIGFLGGSDCGSSLADRTYTHSVYIKNNLSTTLRVSDNNLGADITLNGNEMRRVVLVSTLKKSRAYLQFNFDTQEVGGEFDFTYWHPKIEFGNKATDWSQAPEDVDAKIDSLVALNNLYTGTLDFSGSWNNINSWTRQSEKYNGFTIMSKKGSYAGLCKNFAVNVGEQYTISAYARLKKAGENVSNPRLYVGPVIDGLTEGIGTFNPPNGESFNLSTEWKRYSTSMVCTVAGNMRAGVESTGGNGPDTEIEVCGFKLERGSMATPWQPAPEDNNVLGNVLGPFTDAASAKQAIYDWVVSLKNQTNVGGCGMALCSSGFPQNEETLGQLYSGLFLLIGFCNIDGSYAGILAISYWGGRSVLHATIQNGKWGNLFQPINV